MSSTAASTPRSRWLALSVLCVGQFMIILDGTIVNVALPSVQHSLGFSPSGLAWVVNAYLIPFGGLLLLSGRLGDLLGRARVFRAGLVIFTVASLGCGLAPGPATLLAARFAQGVGGAMASSVTLAMVVTMFAQPRQRAKALGVYGFVQSAGGTLGLLAGGVLTEALNWHWIFLVNLPIGAGAAILAGRTLGAERGRGLDRTTDAPGALLVTAALALAVYTIVETPDHGWASAHTVGFGTAALVLLVAFAVRQAKTGNPLLPPRLLRLRAVSGALGTHALLISGMFGFQFLAVLYLQQVLGFDQVRTGFGVLPVSLLIGLMSLLVAPRAIARFGARAVLLPALLLICLGLLILGAVSADGRYLTEVFPATLPLGIGFGLAMPALAGLAMSGVPDQDSGIASGMFNTMQQVASAISLAVLSAVAATHTNGLLATGQNPAIALSGGYARAFLVGAALVATAFVVAAVALRRSAARPPVEEVATPQPTRSGR